MSEVQSFFEVPPTQERSRVTSHEVRRAYGDFQRNIKQGYSSTAEELGAYHLLLDSTARYFLQAERDLPPSEAESVIANLITFHNRTTDAPIAFFDQIREELDARGKLDGTNKCRYIGAAFRQEAHEVSTSLRVEEHAVDRLRQLASETTGELPGVSLATVTEREDLAKRTALEAIAEDPTMADTFEAVTTYQSFLTGLATEVPQDLAGELGAHREFIGDEVIKDLNVHAFINDQPYIQDQLSALAEIAESPDFTWEQLLKRPDFPSDLYHSFSMLGTFAEIGEIALQLEGQPASVKARYLLPYTERGISGFLLQEMAEGRFTLSDDYLLQQAQTFVDFSQNVEHDANISAHSPVGRTKKLVAAALAAAAVALPLGGSVAQRMGEELKPSASVSQTLPKESLHPENNSPESLLQAQKQTLWELYGADLNGLYKHGVASTFNPRTLSWEVQQTELSDRPMQEISSKDITFTGKRHLTNPFVVLDTKNTYFLTRDSVIVEGAVGDYTVKETTGGNYIIQFSDANVGRDVTVTYSIGYDRSESVPDPTDDELTAMSTKMIEIDDIRDDDLREYLQQLQTSDRTDYQKAKYLQDYIKSTYLYSLDPRISEEYDQATTVGDYFNAIYAKKAGDCDVINSATAMLLRSMNIPARLVTGSAHTGDFINGDPNQITKGEEHAWIEVYIRGEWATLDATPSTMDEITRAKMQNQLHNAPNANANDQDNNPRTHNPDSPSQLDDTGSSDGNDEGGNGSSESMPPLPDLLALLGLAGLSAASITGGVLAIRKNDRKIDQLRRYIQSRTRTYTGSNSRDYRELSDKVYHELYQLAAKRIPAIASRSDYSPLSYLPPFVLRLLYKERQLRQKLSQVPPLEHLPSIRTHTPSPQEYITDVLGYSDTEADITNQIRHDQHLNTQRLFLDGESNTLNLLPRGLRHMFTQLSKPTTQAEWETTKQAFLQQVRTNMRSGFTLQIENALQEALYRRLLFWRTTELDSSTKSTVTQDIIDTESQLRESSIAVSYDRQAADQLSTTVTDYLSELPSVPEINVETVSGVGPITPVGRRQLAVKQLQGESVRPSDYRELEVEVEHERGIKTATIHIVDIVEPKDYINPQKTQFRKKVIKSLESVMQKGSIGNVVVHLVKQNACGQYSMREFRTDSATDLQRTYQDVRRETLEQDSSPWISTPFVARKLIGDTVARSLQRESNSGEVSIPLYLSGDLAEGAVVGLPHIMAQPNGFSVRR
jgi:hypothetical protein